jgi:CRP/FNR family transcriptional regulator, cyclic AMP receptor protein
MPAQHLFRFVSSMSQPHEISRATLEQLAFTQGLESDQQDRMIKIASSRTWNAGITVFREGDLDSSLYVVEQGRVAIDIAVPGRGRMTILTVGPGEVFGWSSLFFQQPKTASARTVEPTSALVLAADQLRELCDVAPQMGYLLTRRILAVVSERLKATRMQLLDIYGH